MLIQKDDNMEILNKNQDELSGFLIIDSIIARSGIQKYKGIEIGLTGENANKIFNVFRPPEEVAKSADSFNGVAFTDEHPKDGAVDTTNVDMLSKGNLSKVEVIKKDGEVMLKGRSTIMDLETIKKANQGKIELSAGYERELIEENGIIDGIEYQYVQRDIKGNHVALVTRGRCGKGCTLNLDSKGIINMAKITIDGAEYEVESHIAQQIGTLTKQVDMLEEKVEKDEKSYADMEAEKKELEGKMQTLNDEMEKMKENQSEDEFAKAEDMVQTGEMPKDLMAKIEKLIMEMMDQGMTPEPMKEKMQKMTKDMVTVSKDAAILGVTLSNDCVCPLEGKREMLKSILGKDSKINVDEASADVIKGMYDVAISTAINNDGRIKESYKPKSNKNLPNGVNNDGAYLSPKERIAASTQARIQVDSTKNLNHKSNKDK